MYYNPSYSDTLRADIQPSYRDSLSHYGIKGQKWGVRRYQNKDGTYTSRGKKRRKGLSKDTVNKLKTAGAVLGTAALIGAGAYALRHKNIVDNLVQENSDKLMSDISSDDLDIGKAVLQKKARYVGYKQQADLEYYRQARKESKKSGFGVIAHRHSMQQDSKDTNPFFGKTHGNVDYIGNCGRCSVAYEMRRRGLNVRATGTPIDFVGTTSSELRKMFNTKSSSVRSLDTDKHAPKTYDEFSKRGLKYKQEVIDRGYRELISTAGSFRKKQSEIVDNLIEHCESFGPNSRGQIGICFYNGAEHSMSFECDSKGKVEFIDAQAGFKGSKDDKFFRTHYMRYMTPYVPIEVTRTDNASLNYNYIKKHKIVESA